MATAPRGADRAYATRRDVDRHLVMLTIYIIGDMADMAYT